ncbi:hypothetical protein COOONC_15639 [Cooperia oncophora]
MLVDDKRVEILLIGHFNLIIAYLRARLFPNVQLATLKAGLLLHQLSSSCAPSESDSGERLLAAELLTKLQSDKLTGPRWTRFITKYLPPIFADALRDSPNTA